MDFLNRGTIIFNLQIMKQHQRGKVICLKLSSSSVVQLGFELGQLDPFLYATLPSIGLNLKDGCNSVIR